MTWLSGSTFRKGDCRREMLSAVFSVSSKIASPVLLAKSARTIVSLSVSFGLAVEAKITAD